MSSDRHIWIPAFVAVGLFFAFVYIAVGISDHKKQQTIEQLEDELSYQKAARVKASLSNQVYLVSDMIPSLKEELSTRSGHLSYGTLQQLSLLSESMKPYMVEREDKASDMLLSPERGLLLMGIISLEIDTHSLDSLFDMVSFQYADLKGVDLNKERLKGIDLSYADVSDVDFSKADLRSCSMVEARVEYAILDRSDLRGADMRRSDLSWAKLEEADLSSSNINGALLTAASFRNADLVGADMKWVKAVGADFREADLYDNSLMGAQLEKADFTSANLGEVHLELTEMEESIWTDANVERMTSRSDASVDIENWRIIGLEDITRRFQIVKDTSRSTGTIFLPRSD